MSPPPPTDPILHPDRDQLFGNEAFVIGMLQAVSGGSVVAGIAQFESIAAHAGLIVFLIFLTVMSFALLTAVLAAYFRHQYKMWDVKRRPTRASFYLKAMRWCMLASALLVVVGVLDLVAGFWYANLGQRRAA
jgi:hypothetical protein